MNAVAQILGENYAPHPLREAFLRWQCRVRQIAMRDKGGVPDDAIMPEVTLPGAAQSRGRLITLITKRTEFSPLAELMHMARKTNEPAQRRDAAIRFLSATHYQKPGEFSDILTATFPPSSEFSRALLSAGRCWLRFDAYAQSFDLTCKIRQLDKKNALYQATWWHNYLFNPNLSADTEILGFEVDWPASISEPPVIGGCDGK